MAHLLEMDQLYIYASLHNDNKVNRCVGEKQVTDVSWESESETVQILPPLTDSYYSKLGQILWLP